MHQDDGWATPNPARTGGLWKNNTNSKRRGSSAGFEYPQDPADIPSGCKRRRPGGLQNDEADAEPPQPRLTDQPPSFPGFPPFGPPEKRKRENGTSCGGKRSDLRACVWPGQFWSTASENRDDRRNRSPFRSSTVVGRRTILMGEPFGSRADSKRPVRRTFLGADAAGPAQDKKGLSDSALGRFHIV
jgi:hypothetical protein